MTIFALTVFTLLYLVSLAGIILPVLPGVPVAAVGALLAGWMTGFEELGAASILWVVGLAVLSQVLDYVAGVVGAKRFGASRAGVWGSVIGSLVGVIWFPPFGFLLGALVGAVVAEIVNRRTLQDSVRSGVGALLGTLGGVVAKFFIVIAIGMIVFPRLF